MAAWVFVTKKSFGISLLTKLLTIRMLFVVPESALVPSSTPPTPIISWNSIGVLGVVVGVDLKRSSRWLSIKLVAVTAEKGEAATHPETPRGDGAAGGRGEARQLLWCRKVSPPSRRPVRGGMLIIHASHFPKHAIEVQIG